MLAAALLVAACYTGPNTDHFAAVLEELAVPGDWELVKTETRGPDADVRCDPFLGGSCPSVTRFYLVDGEALAVFKAAEQMVSAAGFHVDRELIPTCDGQRTGPSCSFESTRDADQIRIGIYRSTQDAGLDSARVGATAVVVTAER